MPISTVLDSRLLNKTFNWQLNSFSLKLGKQLELEELRVLLTLRQVSQIKVVCCGRSCREGGVGSFRDEGEEMDEEEEREGDFTVFRGGVKNGSSTWLDAIDRVIIAARRSAGVPVNVRTEYEQENAQGVQSV